MIFCDGLQKELQQHKAVIWMDHHFRTFRGDWSHIFKTILGNGGLYLFKCTGIPGYVSTHPRVYTYFPANIPRYKAVADYWAGGMYVFNSEIIYWNALYWWYLCALDVNCIAPPDSASCLKLEEWKTFVDRDNPENTQWGKCHRFGQSIISVLANNLYGYSSTKFTHWDADPVATVIREATWMYDLQYCKSRVRSPGSEQGTAQSIQTRSDSSGTSGSRKESDNKPPPGPKPQGKETGQTQSGTKSQRQDNPQPGSESQPKEVDNSQPVETGSETTDGHGKKVSLDV